MQNANLLDAIAKSISIPATEHKGELLDGQRHGKGKETWSQEHGFKHELYKGKFVYDSLHGPGEYTWNLDNQKKIYEGLLYTSKLESYGRLSNEDNSYFEGLFRSSSRFGPGVFTSANGTQDVGMWYGKNLMRLCLTVKPEWVPKIARSAKAKVHLLRYKTLVKVCNDVVDYAKEVLQNINANEEVIQQSDYLYNSFVRHPKSLFFNTVLYEKEFFSSKDCYIEIAADQLLCNTPESEVETVINNNNFFIKAKNELVGQSLGKLRLKDLKDELQRVEKELVQFEEVRQTAINERMKESSLEIISYVEKEKKIVCWDIGQLLNEDSDSVTVDELLAFNLDNCNLDEGAYVEACKALNAAEDAIKILKIKKTKLLGKIKYEESQLHKPLSITPKQPMKKVLITDLLAWNNEETSIEMMKYAFLHRNFENTMTFSVARLLSGNRSEFRARGQYEEDCVAFLSNCSSGNFKGASDLLIKHDLNPDMCDGRGNTGMIFAAARDRHKIIKTLVNFGGNVDVFNDECITPLSLCVLRYLAVQQYVSNWENAFLRPTFANVDADIYQWRPQSSTQNMEDKHISTTVLENTDSTYYKLESLSEAVGSSPDILEADFNLTSIQLKLMHMLSKNLQEAYHQNDEAVNQIYLFNVECLHPHVRKVEGKEQKNKKPKKKKEDKQVEEVPENVEQPPNDILMKDKLRVIYETVLLLLDYGADPNISEAPMPVLLMTLFTKNPQLSEDLLVKKANPDVVTPEEALTGLHILVSLPPCEEVVEQMKMLFKYGANPNLPASVQHWSQEKEALVGNYTLQKTDFGKMPLHLLAMRFDFNDYFSKMAQILIENGALPNKRYLGHTPLSLAVLRGNAKLVQAFLETGKVNPNLMLGEEMGVALTVWTLKRYTAVPTLSECEEITQTLIRFGANPFNSTGEHGNVVEFISKETEVTKKESSKKKSKPTKKEPKAKVTIQDQIKLLIEKAAAEVLQKHIKGWVVKHLYHFVESQDYYDEISERMAKFINVPESISIAQALFHRGEIPIDKVKNYETLHDLIEFIINVNYPSRERKTPTSFNVDINKFLENFEFKKLSPKTGYLNLPQPEVDEHSEKYDVCFYCYRKLNCQLFKCPKCELVYFCSEKCNLLGNKFKSSVHKCNLDFYTTLKEVFDDRKLSRKNSDLEDVNKFGKAPSVKRFVKPDSKRRLHLTRKMSAPLEPISIVVLPKPTSSPCLNVKRFERPKKMPGSTLKKNIPVEAETKNFATDEPIAEIPKAPSVKRFVKPDPLSALVEPISTVVPLKSTSSPRLKVKRFERPKKMPGSTLKKIIPVRAKTKNVVTDEPIAEIPKNNCDEFRRRLPIKYQHFLEKIVEFWPDLDLSLLFLPYACYSNGQLYYRFDANNPVFAETYSIL